MFISLHDAAVGDTYIPFLLQGILSWWGALKRAHSRQHHSKVQEYKEHISD